MKKVVIVFIMAIYVVLLNAQKQVVFNQIDWGYLTTNGGFSMHTYKPLGDLSEDKSFKLGFVVNFMVLNIDQKGDVAFLIQMAPGIGLQASLGNNFYSGIDLGLGTGFSWIKENNPILQSFSSNAHTWNSHLNYGFYSSVYLGFNTGGEKKRFTIRAGVNPFAALSSSTNAIGKTNYFGSTFNIALGFAINKAGK